MIQKKHNFESECPVILSIYVVCIYDSWTIMVTVIFPIVNLAKLALEMSNIIFIDYDYYVYWFCKYRNKKHTYTIKVSDDIGENIFIINYPDVNGAACGCCQIYIDLVEYSSVAVVSCFCQF